MSFAAISQAKQGFGYQAIVRDASEFLSECSSDCRSSLNHYMLSVLEGFVDLIDLGMLHKSACRAYVHALSALDARRFIEASVLSRRYEGLESSVLESEDPESVCIRASCYASSAEDALGCISYESRSEHVDMRLGMYSLERAFSGSRYGSYMEKLALSVLLALLAVLIVVGEQELYTLPSCLYGHRGRDPYLHSFVHRIYAASNEASGSGSFNKAYTA